jgi:hypothetical protein
LRLCACVGVVAQLFSFGGKAHPGSIFINVPFVSFQDKRLCLQAGNATDTEPSVGSFLVVNECDPANTRQRIGFIVGEEVKSSEL